MRVATTLDCDFDNGVVMPDLVNPYGEWVEENETVLQSIDLDNHNDGTVAYKLKFEK